MSPFLQWRGSGQTAAAVMSFKIEVKIWFLKSGKTKQKKTNRTQKPKVNLLFFFSSRYIHWWIKMLSYWNSNIQWKAVNFNFFWQFWCSVRSPYLHAYFNNSWFFSRSNYFISHVDTSVFLNDFLSDNFIFFFFSFLQLFLLRTDVLVLFPEYIYRFIVTAS